MELTQDQKAAGRWFRAFCADLLDSLDPDVSACPPYLTWYRHECREGPRAVESATWAMYLRQYYWRGPAGTPAEVFAFIFRRGECPRCNLRVRSGTGRFVIASDNPPEKGAVVEQPSHGALPGAEAGASQPS